MVPVWIGLGLGLWLGRRFVGVLSEMSNPGATYHVSNIFGLWWFAEGFVILHNKMSGIEET